MAALRFKPLVTTQIFSQKFAVFILCLKWMTKLSPDYLAISIIEGLGRFAKRLALGGVSPSKLAFSVLV